MASLQLETLRTKLLSILAAAVLLACGGGGGGDASTLAASSGYPGAPPASCSLGEQKAWLRDYMNDQYLWYDKQGVANEAATDTAKYLDSLLYKPKDRYSYTQATAQFTQFFAEGTRTGYGYSLGYTDTTQTVLKVRLVEPLSPVGKAGLLRGDTIVSIDGFNTAQIAAGQLAAVSTAGVTRSFVVKNDAQVQRTLTVASEVFALSPVIKSNILTAANGSKLGYLMYQEFISTGASAMGAAFDTFRQAGVTDLILDLRYNGGGSTLQARNLASMAGGSALNGKVFADYRYSAKQSAQNFSQAFSSTGLPAAPVDTIDRIVVIMSGSTASASELVINALKPFKQVVTIGSTSFGKPYAFVPREACGTTYSAANIEIANAAGFSDYSAGFTPTCAVADDLTRQFGDPAEQRIAAALGYLNTGVCPPVSQAIRPQSQLNTAQTATKNIANDLRQLDQGIGEASPKQARID